ncbi:hypothetical protein MTO98_09940 [Mucilaginibacter sp. SMC90]|uniref:hypothetical protein n=1 Tax=Mucilaginibacter sp. SMC90 TaxID=2929803 RepID=UPI001FB2BE3E|nr:hypothetical protein [Mucilaginibacter sp. SMC90]UOE51396.1 hypothetical protein MTO98_09940 [Mucilaginibacter sp. SMC90]
MTSQNNNAGITDDDIKKAEAYKNALDALKTSIIGVNSKLPEFADGIKDGLKALGEKLPEVVDAMQKLNEQNKELAASGQKPKNVLKELASSFLSWNSLISVGITLLASYSDVIIDWVADMLKGQTTLSALGKAMKDNAVITESLIQTKLKGDQAAQSEITNLTALYRATQSHTLLMAEKKKAAAALQDQWPGTFKNMKDEAIIAGDAATAYGNLKDQILAAAYAEAAKSRITVNASRALENDLKIAKERKNNLDLITKEEQANKDYKDYKPVAGDEGWGAVWYADAIDEASKKRASSDKIIYDLSTDTKLLNAQNEKLYDEIEARQKLILSGKKLNESGSNKTNNSDPIISHKKVEKPTIEQTRSSEILQAKAIDFAKQIELDKQNYDCEFALLNKQLDKKLISQEDYNKKSEQLQQKFHLGIGDKIQFFNKNDFAEAQKQMQAVIDSHQHEDTIAKDEKKVGKALLPGQKLEAEKQLIDDKYGYEIKLAAGNADKIKALEDQKQKDITALTQQYEQQRTEFALQTAQQVSDKAFSIIQNNIKSQSDAKIKGLEKDKAAELGNKNLTGTQKKAIEDKYQKQEAAEKVKAFKSEQKASILQAVINGALAVTKATSQTGVLAPFVIPGIIASTAIQVATIVAQKPPQYAKGGLHYESDGRGALLPGYSRTDNTNAYLRSGEAIVVSEAMRNPWARNLVSAINVAHGGRDFSMPNLSRGYAVGGIFTDGGNANRYYNQPVNDVKDLANTLAYQMINNFPPVYVDVKDINNQQNILAQTINRVNL